MQADLFNGFSLLSRFYQGPACSGPLTSASTGGFYLLTLDCPEYFGSHLAPSTHSLPLDFAQFVAVQSLSCV